MNPLRVAAAPMVVVSALLLLVSPHYGPHWDELYFRMLPLRWSYVDQPPLTVWLAWGAARISEDIWVQRVPAAAAAAAGSCVASLYPRVLGAGLPAQRLAAWAHAFTVYPLMMGHIMTTSALDLLAWQVIILLVLKAHTVRPRSLVWAGAVAGLACWNKLLVIALVLGLLTALLLTAPRLLRTRHAWLGAVLGAVIAAPQALLQIVHGLPMTRVSAGLVAEQGDLVRLVLLPATALFAGPPLLLVWIAGLRDPWRLPGRPGRFLLPTLIVITVFTLASPSQPHYPMGVVLAALAAGWASPALGRRWSLRKQGVVVATNAVVAALLCLPLLPGPQPWLTALSQVNPTIRDQLGWPSYARQIWATRVDGEDVIAEPYALAGALHYYGSAEEQRAVYSGHNGLWERARPESDRVLLVGEHAVAHRDLFRSCSSVGGLRTLPVTHAGVRNAPMLRCSSPIDDWDVLWPRFQRISG